jgi:HEPN domain-containing protein
MLSDDDYANMSIMKAFRTRAIGKGQLEPSGIISMNIDEVVRYWLESAEDDWPVAEHLFASGDYHSALFFGHLYLEKLLKALGVKATGAHALRAHNLLLLAERAGLTVPEDRRDILVRVTGYNIEARYPEEPLSARKRYTKAYAETERKVIQEVGAWLISELELERA